MTVFQSVAIVITLFRLSFHLYATRLWWDDCWAAISLVLNALLFAVIILSTEQTEDGTAKYNGHRESTSSTRFFSWFIPFVLSCAVWSARISIATAMYRVRRSRAVALGAILPISLLWLVIVLQKSITCATWPRLSDCELRQPTAITELCSEHPRNSLRASF